MHYINRLFTYLLKAELESTINSVQLMPKIVYHSSCYNKQTLSVVITNVITNFIYLKIWLHFFEYMEGYVV